jgi:hypothetical protein
MDTKLVANVSKLVLREIRQWCFLSELAVSYGSNVGAISTDGKLWSTTKLPSSNDWHSIEFGQLQAFKLKGNQCS